jgi:hypothetical protein
MLDDRACINSGRSAVIRIAVVFLMLQFLLGFLPHPAAIKSKTTAKTITDERRINVYSRTGCESEFSVLVIYLPLQSWGMVKKCIRSIREVRQLLPLI